MMAEFLLHQGPRRDRELALAAEVLGGLPRDVVWRVQIERAHADRSDAQNRYLWAVPIKMISEATGYEKAEVHEYLLGEHFGWKKRRVPKRPGSNGWLSVPVRTTTTDEHGRRSKLSPQQFSDYVAFIQRFAAMKLQLIIPDPDPMWGQH